ncbi:MAG TPA: hypothetical protein VII97_13140 [Anaerolineales bacterium]
MAKRKTETNLPLPTDEIIADYRLAYRSRQASIIGRREVLSGKAKFGIFGDGKELPQVAMARAFREGDWRSGYYRDQTWVHALGVLPFREFFTQLYAHADLEADPATAGRSVTRDSSSRSCAGQTSCPCWGLPGRLTIWPSGRAPKNFSPTRSRVAPSP